MFSWRVQGACSLRNTLMFIGTHLWFENHQIISVI